MNVTDLIVGVVVIAALLFIVGEKHRREVREDMFRPFLPPVAPTPRSVVEQREDPFVDEWEKLYEAPAAPDPRWLA